MRVSGHIFFPDGRTGEFDAELAEEFSHRSLAGWWGDIEIDWKDGVAACEASRSAFNNNHEVALVFKTAAGLFFGRALLEDLGTLCRWRFRGTGPLRGKRPQSGPQYWC